MTVKTMGNHNDKGTLRLEGATMTKAKLFVKKEVYLKRIRALEDWVYLG
jgi:hypothetical protein